MKINTWNPWHGCKKYSEGCEHCYMYYLDAQRGRDGNEIYRTKTNFDLPLKKTRQGTYKISSGTMLHVCMTSDFFLEEADAWRDAVWDMIRIRSDVSFWIQTKRAERIQQCLQLGIRYDLQLGTLPLPKTTHKEYMIQNADVDFVISDEDMARLGAVEEISSL